MNAPLLSNLENIPDYVRRPTYTPSAHKTGIVHLGLGAFHKSHQAFYTDAAIESSGGDWRIVGVSMRNRQLPIQVAAQNGLYTLIVRNPTGPTARVIASIESALCAVEDTTELLKSMCSPDTRIVSLTVTEKGYGFDRGQGGINHSDVTIANDLIFPEAPKGVLGLIVRSLQIRRQAGIAPFTVLCCDNLPANGQYVKQGALDYAELYDQELAHWISDNVPFPATMVDRITPAQSPQTLATSELLTGHRDLLTVEAEPFHQWVIEDNFVNGRPDWQAAGALFTDNVAPFEEMKLRMLNGAHSMLAYGGFLAGKKYVRDVMHDPSLATLVARHMQAASLTLSNIPCINFDEYASHLLQRFANPEIAHETWQIAGDGSQKMPQRIFEPALAAIERHTPTRPFAFATALWMHYCHGTNSNGSKYQINDPIASTVQSAAGKQNSQAIVNEFSQIPGLIPAELSQNPGWNQEIVSLLSSLKETGVRTSLDKEASIAITS